MKQYLNSLIYEQICKAEFLKEQIEKPPPFRNLSSLKETLTSNLNTVIHQLNTYLSDLQESMDDEEYRNILRLTRQSTREISLIESYGISPFLHQTKKSNFLSNVAFKICQETNNPISSPSVCCISTNYYYSIQFSNVIFVPLAESDFLLHLPDLYHEIGHFVSTNKKMTNRLAPIDKAFSKAFDQITLHYTNIIKEYSKNIGYEEGISRIKIIHSQWRSWLEEFFCDLFALYSLGPAYAWSHMHLTMKESDDIYHLSTNGEQTHPSDESRMRMLFAGLYLLDLKQPLEEIDKEWKKIKKYWGEAEPNYSEGYPNSLLTQIAKIFLESMREAEFTIVTEDNFKKSDENYVRFMLNEAWKSFWTMTSEDFRNWELEQIRYLEEITLKMNP